MAQLNIHMSPAFERNLKRFMRVRGIKTKSDAVRTAVNEALESAQRPPSRHLRDLAGIAANLPTRPRKEWLTEDQLWEPDDC